MGTLSIQVSFEEMKDTFYAILLRHGFTKEQSTTLADVFAINSLEGIYTHGVNRFPRFISYVRDGHVKTNAAPSKVKGVGGLEQWDGNLGPGPLNAIHATNRATELAEGHGIGCVALANTNHWMRGGYYGWQAAKKGFVFIGWTNTTANMPTWGAINSKLGNNPLVFAVPFGEEGIVLDAAMSQYSYGMLDLYKLKNEKLPVAGGFDAVGNLTNDPEAIIQSQRVLPIGYWKGAGLSLLLDILGAILSGGLSTSEISKKAAESGLSQVFIAIDLKKLQNFPSIESTIQSIIEDYHRSISSEDGKAVRYPGERVKQIREENLSRGIPVVQGVWEEILTL